MPAQPVIFAYRKADRSMGSKIMRCDQLCAMAARLGGDGHGFAVLEVPPPGAARRLRRFARQTSGAVVIGLKHAFTALPPEVFEDLRTGFAAYCIDHVDSVPEDAMLLAADAHILASFEGMRRVRARLRALGAGDRLVRHVTHHADPRLPAPAPLNHAAPDRLRAVYLGNPANTVLPRDPGLAGRITILDHLEIGFETALAELPAYNLHYAVRRTTRNRHASKPFTKGFTAAALRANILVDAGTDDARHYLGADYPFLIPSNAAGDIAAGVAHVTEAFGTAEWRRGLEAMDYVRHVSSPRHVVGELVQVLRDVA